MQYLIVHAHHEPQSFNGAQTQAAIDAIESAGHTAEVSDLYAMGFDPVSDRRNFTTTANPDYLKQQDEERHASENNGFAPDITAEIDKLQRCDVMIFQFPLWWFGMPAILKGWCDRVLVAGKVYGGGKWYETGIAAGKRAMISMTTGGPEPMYGPAGLNPRLDHMLAPVTHGIFWFLGFKPVAPFVTWGPAHMSNDERTEQLERYRETVLNIPNMQPLQCLPAAEFSPQIGYADKFARYHVTWTATSPPAQLRSRIIDAHAEGHVVDHWQSNTNTAGGFTLRAPDEQHAHDLINALTAGETLDTQPHRIS